MSPFSRHALVAGVIALLILAGYVVRIRTGMVDFAVNYRAGQRLMAGETLYQTADGHYMFKYLPASALIYLPLGRMPVESAKATWFAISLLALAWSFALVHALVPLPHRQYLLGLSALVLAKYFLHELSLGQINILITLLMLLATRALSQNAATGHDAAAGVLAGIATAMKPYAAVFFLYLLIKRNWVAVAAGLGTLATALLLPSLFYGVNGNLRVLREWAVTLSQSTPALLTNSDNVSVLAFFAKWLGPSTRALVAGAAVLAALALLMLAVIQRGSNRRADAVLECALLLTLIPLISPLGWDYTFVTSLLAVALLVNEFDAFPRAGQIVLAVNFGVIALAAFDLMGRHAYALFMQWSVTTLNFLVVVVALASLRFRPERQPAAEQVIRHGEHFLRRD
ncbi:MAG TPA: glycosyltransferase family 87 protein [Vicinamibacterales bacterium]|nr:glycosyltransferase family 87 protein [Vicinamibacterales bacterium]